MENTIKTLPSTLLLADVLSGRPLSEDRLKTAPDAEEAYALASAYFARSGADTYEGYLAHRTEVKAGLNRLAREIRALKAEYRFMDGLSSGFYATGSRLEALRAEFIALHDLRRLGKAWSPLARARQRDLHAA